MQVVADVLFGSCSYSRSQRWRQGGSIFEGLGVLHGFSSLDSATPRHLDLLVSGVGGDGAPLQGRADVPGATVVVGRELRVRRECGRVLGEVLIERELEFWLLEALEAVCRVVLAVVLTGSFALLYLMPLARATLVGLTHRVSASASQKLGAGPKLSTENGVATRAMQKPHGINEEGEQ